MTTSNAITMDHIRSFYSLRREVPHVELAATATGGLGIDNIDQFPPPKPVVRRKTGTEYSKKFIQEDKLEQNTLGRQTLDLPGGSTVNMSELDDIESLSTLAGDIPMPSEINSEMTQEIYSTYYRSDVTYDSALPITSYREQILKLLNVNPVIIIEGATGCGKTTQVPQYILDYHASRKTFCNIIVTQPRKIAATSIARRVCQERHWQMGTLVGYQVAMDNKTSEDTRLTYVTTGVLLQKIINNKRMDMYTHVIIDEVHERDQDTDFALLIVKKLLKTNSRRVKVILMSATINTSMFAKYFALTPKGDPAPIIEVFGKSKEVSEHYLDELGALGIMIPDQDPYLPSIPEPLYDIVVRLMFFFDKIEKSEQNIPMEEDYAPSRGAVLIFLPGYEEITQMSNKLRGAAFNRKFWILPLHSTITLEEQTRVFREPPADHRKVIISTNIAESSITVSDIRYVIDFCLTKSLVCDSETNYICLQLEWASKANCTQRKGRAGRVEIGRVYRMVDRKFYNNYLPEYGIPEMQRCPLTQLILYTKKLDFGPPQAMLALALEPPNLSDIENAMLELKEALAITVKPGDNLYEGDLTCIGRVMANLPLDVKMSKLILFGFLFGFLEECVIIAASLSLKNFFAKPFQRLLDAYNSRLSWAEGTFSDCLCYLYAFKTWKKLSVQGFFRRPGGQREIEWAEKSFIQIKRIKEVDMLVKELKKRLEEFEIRVYGNQDQSNDQFDVLLLKMVIAAAFYPNYYLQEDIVEEEVLRATSNNDPHSTVIVSGFPSNQGLLYATSLRDMLACCGKKMNIDFEEKKAYIQFDRQTQDTSNVLPAVYLAMKMRQLRIPLELVLFKEDDAARKMEQLRKLKQSEYKYENRLRSNRFSIQFNKTSLKRVPLPPIQATVLQMFITHIDNCGHFWARYVDAETSNALKFLDTTINMHQGKNLQRLDRPPEPDMLILAPFSDVKGITPMYYRAQIQQVGRQKVKVFFIDYGNMEEVLIDDLRAIDEEMPDVLNTPGMAFECCLAEVKPSLSTSPTGQWSVQANRWFTHKVNGVVLKCQIYSVIQNIVRVDAYDRDRDGIFQSLAKQLISLNYAESAEETYISKQNHELRIRCNNYMSHTASQDTDFAMQVSTEDLGNLKTTTRRSRLHGPSNPLEVNFRGISYIDMAKPVKVERDSVNSVTFNTGPQDCPNMLIAANVSIGQNNDTLCARSTTLMPKIKGLPSLICLLFAPNAEFRFDAERRHLTGAICGLGFNPDTGDPLYQDHDIEMDFDIEIDDRDIKDINSFRMFLNYIYGQDNGITSLREMGIKKLQEKLCGTVHRLLERKRKPRAPTYFNKRYSWRQVPLEYQLEQELPEGLDRSECVLPILKPINLKDDKEPHPDDKDAKDRQFYRRHFNELVSKAGLSKELHVIRCHFCSEDLTSSHALLLHLDSTKHEMNERRIMKI